MEKRVLHHLQIDMKNALVEVKDEMELNKVFFSWRFFHDGFLWKFLQRTHGEMFNWNIKSNLIEFNRILKRENLKKQEKM